MRIPRKLMGGGGGVQEDEQRGKGRRKGRMEWTQDVGNRHRRGWGADGAALSGRAFINNARGGPGGRLGARRAAELALCFQCVSV